jgi:hypothetical protein
MLLRVEIGKACNAWIEIIAIGFNVERGVKLLRGLRGMDREGRDWCVVIIVELCNLKD